MSRKIIAVWTVSCLIAFALVTTSPANIVTTSCTQVAPPTSVVEGATESNTNILAFNEKQDFALPSDTFVNISSPGTYLFFPGQPIFTPASIPAGSVVDSHLLHFDPVSAFPPAVEADCSVTFDCDVIGIIVLSADLDNSDGLGAAATTYPAPGLNPRRGLDEHDSVTLSADRRTVTVHLESDTSFDTDHIRVITQCQPAGECPHTQGFWKNHPEAWPVTSLVLGDETYNQAELLAILKTPPKGDASLILAHQLIATKLSIASGSDPSSIGATVTHADSLLAPFIGKLPYGVKTSSSEGKQMVNDSKALDSYNNGALTPECSR